MADFAPGRRFDRAEAGTLAVVAAVSVAALALLGGYSRIDLPFAYSGDVIATGAGIKGMIDHGWYLVNPSVGAPGVMNVADFPGTDIFGLALMKAISWFSGDWAVVMNVFFLLGFPLAAMSALAALRSLGIGRIPAAVAALLFAADSRTSSCPPTTWFPPPRWSHYG
jgi:hypothetical protein